MAGPAEALDEQYFLPSLEQERLFAEERLFATEAVYTVATGVRLRGRLDVGALRGALSAVADRHEMLRCALRLVSGRPRIVLAPRGTEPELTHHDLREHAQDQRERLAWQHLDQAQRRSFDLGTPPLWRALLLTVDDDEHLLLLTVHHIVVDGWAMDTVWHELAQAYGMVARGEPPVFPPLPVTYTEHVARQRAALSGNRLDRLLDYWAGQLADLPGPLELPLDRARSAQRSYTGAGHGFTLPPDLTARARKLAADNRTTLFVVLLAVFARLLARYGDTEDVTVGVPLANRDHTEARDLVGLLTNPLPLRLRMMPDATVAELLAETRAVTVGAIAHQEVPFGELVRRFAPLRSTQAHPLFQVLFSAQTVPAWNVAFPGLDTSGLDLPDGPAAGVDLTVVFNEAGEDVTGFFEYREDVWERGTIERLAAHFTHLLTCAVEPGARVSDLTVHSPAELDRLTSTFARGQDAAEPALVHELVEQVVDRTPNAVAVSDGQTQLTYRELDRAANALALRLREHGVGREELVAVCLPRGPDLVCGWLGVLKAGGGYVPLDPAHPAGRLRRTIQDAGVRAVLTVGALRDRLGLADIATVCVDEQADGVAMATAERPAVTVHPDNLAYVTYTSGSTGAPKGVLVTHRALANFMTAQPLRPLPSDMVGLHTSPAFDVAGYEVWGTLGAGARIRTVPGTHRPELADYRVLARECSLLFVPPGLYAALADNDVVGLDRVRTLVIGGDRVDGERVSQHRDRPDLVTFNGYGPTEGTVFATTGSALRRAPSGRVPIGRPLRGVECYLLDEELTPVPIGVVGELFLGGACVARGYHDSPALTAQRFLPSPFRPGERLYRTGDRVRWLPDGALEFIGRVDNQVKVRGFRVEPGEVEAVLREFGQVGDAAVVLRRDRPDTARLVAYVVPDGELSQSALFEHLRDRLPDYLVPAAVEELPALPLNSNGKIDRTALPAPRTPESDGPAGPMTATQLLVAAAWREALEREDIGLDENFFELGGDSLLALRVVGLLERGNVTISLAQLYRRATVRACAAHIDETTLG